MIGVGSVGSGGVIFEADIRTSSTPWVFATSLDLASKPGSFGNPDLHESEFVCSVVNVCRPCRTSVSGRFKNSARSGTLSKEMGLLRGTGSVQ